MQHLNSFKTLKRALRLARQANQTHKPPIDELVELQHVIDLKRRDFLKLSLAGLVGTTIASSLPYPVLAKSYRTTQPTIAIVGAGIAGLNAAYTLKNAGIHSQIYESSTRNGGRIFSVKDALAPGLVSHLGGSFIDTNHKEILKLVKEFNLELLDLTEADDLLAINSFGDKRFSEKQLVAALQPLEEQIDADLDTLDELIDFEHEGGATELDNKSLSEYLDDIGATGWIRSYLEALCTSEFGLDPEQQSALNFLSPLAEDLDDDDYERYVVKGGSGRIIEELAKRLQGQIDHDHTLEAIRSQGSGFVLTFQKAGGVIDVQADVVILTLPFSVLRHINIAVDLPDFKKKAIKELGYGMNAKVLMGFRDRVWQDYGYSGEILSDTILLATWEDSLMQSGNAGAITFYFGGKASQNMYTLLADPTNPLLFKLNDMIPGVAKEYNGHMSFWHWPSFPLSLGSYSCYLPGQWTTIAGAQAKPVGNLLFAGEHCSSEFWGYMNGAAETGRKVAQKLVLSLG